MIEWMLILNCMTIEPHVVRVTDIPKILRVDTEKECRDEITREQDLLPKKNFEQCYYVCIDENEFIKRLKGEKEGKK